MMVIVKPKMDVALRGNWLGRLMGSQADLLAPKFHATKSHVFQQKIPGKSFKAFGGDSGFLIVPCCYLFPPNVGNSAVYVKNMARLQQPMKSHRLHL